MNLFTYGTLMFPEIWERVVGRGFATLPATLSGYAVFRVAHGVYPVMVAAGADARVRGLIYRDVDAAAMSLLDEYESDLYDRVAVSAAADDGLVKCEAYVLPADRRSYASDQPWEADKFRRESLAVYLRRLAEV
jgi:gamma-glutamylcyclotransferase (GGCT)/AIG2-like uncharacterized protein YtfP